MQMVMTVKHEGKQKAIHTSAAASTSSATNWGLPAAAVVDAPCLLAQGNTHVTHTSEQQLMEE